MPSILKRPAFLWTLIFIISLSLRFWYSSTEICFYTDQARDALIANRILQGDLQLFGPVVNVTGAVFHGVLYYYVIAPLYALGGGSPLFVNIALSLLSTIGLLPTYFLAKRFLRSQTLAFLVIAMVSVSLTSIETSAAFWNLQLSIVLLPSYFLYLLKMYEKPSLRNAGITGLLLGLLIQSGFSNVQWLLPYVVVIGILWRKSQHSKLFHSIAASVFGLGMATSSMIAVELLAWKRGLFAMKGSLHWVSGSGFSIEGILFVAAWYFNSWTSFLVPQLPIVTVIFVILATIMVFLFKTDRRWWWFGLLLIPPIGGQLVSNSAASYVLTGYESIAYVLVVFVVSKAFEVFKNYVSKQQVKILSIVALLLFALSHVAQLKVDKATNHTLACTWDTGTFEELVAIDYTYQKANGEPFSIDVTVEPYGINMKYGYLYSWYGQKNYGYTPTFIGSSQTGHLSEGILDESSKHSQTHFIIYEPGSYNYWFKRRVVGEPVTIESQEIFYYRQPSLDELKETQQFGKLITVDYYVADVAEQ